MAYFTIEGYDSYSGCDITVTASLPNINGQQMNKYYTLGSLQTLSISTHQDKRPVRSLGVVNAKDYVMGPRTIAGSMVFAVFNRHFATEIMNDLGASDSDVLLPDEIPALNITINFANEYGRMSRMAIYGVKIINEGQVMSINDLYTENTYQFVALGLEPLSSSVNENRITSSVSSTDKPIILATERKILNSSPISSGSSTSPRDTKLLDDYYPTANATPRKVLDDYYNMAKATSRKVLDSDNKIFPQYTDDWTPELIPFIPGKDIVTEITNNKTAIDNNKDYNNNFILDDVINLEVDTQKTLTNFTLTPDRDNGSILISKAKNDFNESNINNGGSNTGGSNTGGTVQPIIKDHEYKIDVANKKNYIMTLPPGEYVAQYESPNYEYSNIVDFITVNDDAKESIKNNTTYPFIDKMTDSYTIVSNGDYSHNTITYLLDGGIMQYKNISKAPVEINGLNPDSNYLFYTDTKQKNDSNKRSGTIKSKTYKTSEDALHIFKDFLVTNQKYLINNLDELLNLLEGYDDDDYLGIIDLVLSLPNGLKKQELLIYANVLNKQLIDSYNKSNTNIINQKIQRTPFSDVITINNSTKAFVYSFDNFKSSLSTIVNPITENFYGKKNKHYCIQTIDDGIKSVKYDFVICDKDYYNELKNYCDLEKYKDINLDYYLGTYNVYDHSVVQTIAIKDNCYCDVHILDEPFIYEEDDEVFADIEYLTLNEESDYYLVCSHIYDALDYVPKRKVKIPKELSKLKLSNYYLGMIKNEKYLFWIENSEFLRISKPYVFSYTSDKDCKQLKAIEKNETDGKLSRLKNDLLVLIDNKSLVTDFINYISSLNPSRKDLNSIIRMYFIYFFENSYAIKNTFIMFYYLIKITHSYRTINNLDLAMTLNINNRTINIECEDEYYVCAIHYDSEKYKRINIDKFIYYEDHGYTLIYLIHKNLNYQSGFVLLENSTGEFLTSEDMVNVVKKVGGK